MMLKLYLLLLACFHLGAQTELGATNALESYLESINSLRFKKASVLEHMKTLASMRDENAVHLQVWMKKQSGQLKSNVGCELKLQLTTDINLIEASFPSDELYYCDERQNQQNATIANIYKTKLVFGNKDYSYTKFLGSRMLERVKIEFECNQNVFINNICFGFNAVAWRSGDVTSKSFCLDRDIIRSCYEDLFTPFRFSFEEKNNFNLIFSNLDEIHKGLTFINKDTYDEHIDTICDNIQVEQVEGKSECKCAATEWKNQKNSNNIVYFVGFEPEINAVLINPSKCNEKIN